MKAKIRIEAIVFILVACVVLAGALSLTNVFAEKVKTTLTPPPKKILLVGNGPGITDTRAFYMSSPVDVPSMPGDERILAFFAPIDGPTNYNIKAMWADFMSDSGAEYVTMDQGIMTTNWFSVPENGTNYFTGQTNLTNIKRGKVNYVPYRLNYNTFVSSNTPDCFIGFKIYGSTGAGTNVQAYEGVSVMAVDSPTGGRQE